MTNVLTCIKTAKRGNYTYKLMASGKVLTHVHINTKTNNDSVIVPVDILRELIQDSF